MSGCAVLTCAKSKSAFVTAPVAVGVLIGATAGSHLLGKLHSRVIRLVFVVVLLWVSAEMLIKGLK